MKNVQYDRNTAMSDTHMVPVGFEDHGSDDESGLTAVKSEISAEVRRDSRKRPAVGRLDDRKVSGARITENVNRCLTAIARINAKNEELSSEIMREREENAELKAAVEKAEGELSDPALIDALDKLEDLLTSMGFDE